MTETEDRLRETLRDSFGTTGASASQLLDVSGIPKASFYRALKALADKGIVANVGTATRTRYILQDRQAQL